MPTRRQWLAKGSLALSLAAAVALFVVVNLAGSKFWRQFDWTRTGLYSLSSASRDAIVALDQDVRIVSFLANVGQIGEDLLQQIRATLSAFQELNPQHIRFESIDVTRDPLRAQALLKEFNLDPLRDSINVVVVEAGPRSKQIRLADMVEFEAPDERSRSASVRSLKVEGAITGAILAVTRERRPRVLFSTGHGEVDRRLQGEGGLSRFVETLQRQDIDVDAWDAVGAQSVPAGTDLLIVAGPTTAWLDAERDALKEYLDQGGRAMLLLDPVFQRGEAGVLSPTGLEPVLEAFGVALDDDIVIDPERGLPFFGAETFYAPAHGLHPVTSSFAGQPVLFSLARSLSAAPSSPENTVVSTLIETSGQSWGERDLAKLPDVNNDETDLPGPSRVAVAVERSGNDAAAGAARGARLVVVGDADVITNRTFDQLLNRSFALNATSWLLEENRALGIEPKERSLTKLFLTSQQLRLLFVVLVIGMPVLTVGVGLVVGWRRHRR